MATGQYVDAEEPMEQGEPMEIDRPDIDTSQVRKLTLNQNKRKLLQEHWC